MFEEENDEVLPESPGEVDGSEGELDPDFEDLDEVPSDEAEEVTPEEAAQATIPFQREEEEEVPHLTSLVCEVCNELNLTTKVERIETCMKCGQIFCLHFCSAVDVSYCVNCMSDVWVTKQTVTKSYEHKNEETGAVTYYRRRATDIKIGGLSWLFAQRKIATLSDVELDLDIEYHRNIYSLLIAEAERRRNEKMHRYAGVKQVRIPSGATVTTKTEVKKTRTISKNKAAEQAAAILSSMKAKGINLDEILKALKK